MGLLFTTKFVWTSAKIKLAAQSQKAIISIHNYQRAFGYLLQGDSFKLFESMVKPILCYDQKFGDTDTAILLNQFMWGIVKDFWV